MNRITYDDFLEKYEPQENRLAYNAPFDDLMFETFGVEWEHVRDVAEKFPRKIWTLTETEDTTIITNGLSLVNRLGYFITDKEFAEDDQISVILYDEEIEVETDWQSQLP